MKVNFFWTVVYFIRVPISLIVFLDRFINVKFIYSNVQIHRDLIKFADVGRKFGLHSFLFSKYKSSLKKVEVGDFDSLFEDFTIILFIYLFIVKIP